MRMGMGLLVGVWVARYLGPEQFGLFNYATAIVALFTAFGSLGLNNIVVRELVRHPADASTTIGTAFVLQMIGGILGTGGSVIAVRLMRPEDTTATIIVAMIGSSMLFKASDVIRYWFEAKVQSKYTVLVENAAFLIISAIKVGLILTSASIMAFVALILMEAGLVAALLLFVYTQQGNRLSRWSYNFKRAKSLLHDSWPLILSGLATMLYMRMDQIMLGQMLGDEAVGIYSAAVRISEVWYFIPLTIMTSVFPSIIKARDEDLNLYYTQLQKLLELMMLIALTLALPISVTSEWIMSSLYGNGYNESAQVLVIHIWAGIFVFSGVAGGRWFIAENLQKYTFYRTLAGCGVNLLLNYLLIPMYGVLGSAWATVISQAVASVFFNAINIKTRVLFIMQIKAITGVRFLIKLKRKC